MCVSHHSANPAHPTPPPSPLCLTFGGVILWEPGEFSRQGKLSWIWISSSGWERERDEERERISRHINFATPLFSRDDLRAWLIRACNGLIPVICGCLPAACPSSIRIRQICSCKKGFFKFFFFDKDSSYLWFIKIVSPIIVDDNNTTKHRSSCVLVDLDVKSWRDAPTWILFLR